MADTTEAMASLWNFLDRKLEGKIDAPNLLAVLGLINLYAIFSTAGISLPLTTENKAGPNLAAEGDSPGQVQDLQQTLATLLEGPLGEKLPPSAKTALSGLFQNATPAENAVPAESVTEQRDKAAENINLLSSLSSLLAGQSGPRLDPVTLLALLSLFGRRERRETRTPENQPEPASIENGKEDKTENSEDPSAEEANTPPRHETAPEAKPSAVPIRVSHRRFGDRRKDR